MSFLKLEVTQRLFHSLKLVAKRSETALVFFTPVGFGLEVPFIEYPFLWGMRGQAGSHLMMHPGNAA